MSQDPILTAIAKLREDLREEIADLHGEIGASEKRLREDLIGMINVGNENILSAPGEAGAFQPVKVRRG